MTLPTSASDAMQKLRDANYDKYPSASFKDAPIGKTYFGTILDEPKYKEQPNRDGKRDKVTNEIVIEKKIVFGLENTGFEGAPGDGVKYAIWIELYSQKATAVFKAVSAALPNLGTKQNPYQTMVPGATFGLRFIGENRSKEAQYGNYPKMYEAWYFPTAEQKAASDAWYASGGMTVPAPSPLAQAPQPAPSAAYAPQPQYQQPAPAPQYAPQAAPAAPQYAPAPAMAPQYPQQAYAPQAAPAAPAYAPQAAPQYAPAPAMTPQYPQQQPAPAPGPFPGAPAPQYPQQPQQPGTFDPSQNSLA